MTKPSNDFSDLKQSTTIDIGGYPLTIGMEVSVANVMDIDTCEYVPTISTRYTFSLQMRSDPKDPRTRLNPAQVCFVYDKFKETLDRQYQAFSHSSPALNKEETHYKAYGVMWTSEAKYGVPPQQRSALLEMYHNTETEMKKLASMASENPKGISGVMADSRPSTQLLNQPNVQKANQIADLRKQFEDAVHDAISEATKGNTIDGTVLEAFAALPEGTPAAIASQLMKRLQNQPAEAHVQAVFMAVGLTLADMDAPRLTYHDKKEIQNILSPYIVDQIKPEAFMQARHINKGKTDR